MQELSQSLKALNHRPISYYKCYAKIMGSVAGGVALSQLMFHYACADGNIFAKKDEDLRRETGLSIRELRETKLQLKKLPFVSIEVRGIPPVTFYKIDEASLWHTLGTFPNLNDGVQIKPNDGVQINSHGLVQNIKRDLQKDIREISPSIVSMDDSALAQINKTREVYDLPPLKEEEVTAASQPGQNVANKGETLFGEAKGNNSPPLLALPDPQSTQGLRNKTPGLDNETLRLSAIETLKTLVASVPMDESRNAKSFHESIFQAIKAQGWVCQKEYWVKDRGDGKRGRIDIVVTTPLPIAIEIDRNTPRKKSVTKINGLPWCRVIILRSSEGVDDGGDYDAVLSYPRLCPGYIYRTPGRETNSPEAQTVLDYLNQIAHREYRVVGEIQKRLNEGATIDECKLMIDYLGATRSTQWKRDWFNHTTPFWRDNFDRNLASAKAWRPELQEAPPSAPGVVADDLMALMNTTIPERSPHAPR
jgi:uncharacterized phage protein (TIGR02220 family)